MNLKTEHHLTAFNAVTHHQPQAAAVIAFDELPDSAMLRMGSFASDRGKLGLLPLSPSSVWRKVKDGTFPAPLKLGSKTTVWRVSDIRRWMAEQLTSTPKAQ